MHLHSEIILAQTLNIVLPTSITEALAKKIVVETLSITRTLKIGSQRKRCKNSSNKFRNSRRRSIWSKNQRLELNAQPFRFNLLVNFKKIL